MACNENKAAFAKKNYGYGSLDKIMCGDTGRWGLMWHETKKKAATVGM